MAEELSIDGKSYITSKRASQTTGYAQDYIGQLARSGQIDAQRVGGLWYVSLESLMSYKQKAETYKPQPPQTIPYRMQDPETLISFDGKEYVSAARASRLSGYHADYVGQLARSGTIQSKQVGNRWYVERVSLEAHKAEKDALLAAVQTQAVGLTKRSLSVSLEESEPDEPILKYTREEGDLIPAIATKDISSPEESLQDDVSIQVPIHHAISTRYPQFRARRRQNQRKQAIVYGSLATAALTIVIVLSFGFTTLKSSSTYAIHFGPVSSRVMPAAVGEIADTIESLFVTELRYRGPAAAITIPASTSSATTSAQTQISSSSPSLGHEILLR